MLKIALYDGRKGSPTYKEINEFYTGIHNPMLIHVPAGIYHGWMGVSREEAVVVNVPTEAYNYSSPDEQRLDPHKSDIPYDWRRRDG
jgi:dTDP-4-dehydrorhamnose 3,5-epimerase